MRMKASFRVWHAAFVFVVFILIWIIQFSNLSPRKLTPKGFQARDLDAVLEHLGNKLEFDPWNDAVKEPSTDVSFMLKNKNSYSDDELEEAEQFYIDHYPFNHTHPLVADKLHIFYQTRLSREGAAQREVIRAHHKQWKQNRTGLIPISYQFVALKSLDKEIAQQIQHENDLNDDIAITATLFQSQHLRQDVLLFNEALKSAKKFLFDDFPPITRERAQREVALFVKSTDVVDFKVMEKVILQMNGPGAETTNLISFAPRRANNLLHEDEWLIHDPKEFDHRPVTTCGIKVLVRCDHVADWADMLDDAWEEVKYARDAESIKKLFTGVLRMQAGINDITTNSVLNAVITLPFETTPTGILKKWVDDLKPPAVMNHGIPAKYLTTLTSKLANETDHWVHARSDLIRAVPDCDTNGLPLVLITTARTNFKNREIIRLYNEALETKASFRFLIGHMGENEDLNSTQQVNAEVTMYNDFVIGGYTDTYENLNLKTLSAYNYVHAKCQVDNGPNYVIFHDDDVLLDARNLDNFMKHDPMPHMACLVHYNDGFARPKRFTKYNVTFEHWESGYYFPKFCSGPATGETIPTVVKIYEKAKETLNLDLKLEDVLFTGVLRETAGVPPPIDYSKQHVAIQEQSVSGYANSIRKQVYESGKKELRDKVDAFLPYSSMLPSATIPPWAREQQKEHENEVPKEISHKEHHKKKSKV